MHESAEDAILRELKEELCIDASIVRPLWVNQGFFIEDSTDNVFHEICIYYLMDITNSALLHSESEFVTRTSKHNEIFYWLDKENLKNEYLYPLFIKDKINSLPEHLEILSEREY